MARTKTLTARSTTKMRGGIIDPTLDGPIKRPKGYAKYIEDGIKNGFVDDPNRPRKIRVGDRVQIQGDKGSVLAVKRATVLGKTVTLVSVKFASTLRDIPLQSRCERTGFAGYTPDRLQLL